MEIDIIQIIIDLLCVWSGLTGGLSAVAIAVTLLFIIFHFTLEKTFLKFLNWIVEDTSFGNWMTKQALLVGILILIVFVALLIYSEGVILLAIPLFWLYKVAYKDSTKEELTSFLKKAGIYLIVSFFIYFLLFDYSSFSSPDSTFYDLKMTLYIFIPVIVGVVIEQLIRLIRYLIKSTIKGVRKMSDEVDVELKKEAEQENKEIE
jgi:hypothetical protein